MDEELDCGMAIVSNMIRTNRAALALALGIFAASGCGIDSGHGTYEQDLGAPGSLSALPARGGTGGGDIGNHDVGIVYAFRVQSGALVDQMEFAYYLPSQPDNQYHQGDFFGTTGAFGGTGGSDSGWQFCPGGFGAVGLQGGSGELVDRLGMICGLISNPTQQTTTSIFGGTGGSSFFDTCSAAGFLSGVAGRAGKFVDRVQGLCRSQN
jgi:hypothetical protein